MSNAIQTDLFDTVDSFAEKESVLFHLSHWVERGWLRELDARFARFLWAEVPQAHPHLILATALASYQLGRGHVCLDLASAIRDPEATFGQRMSVSEAEDLRGSWLQSMSLDAWLQALNCPDLVGREDGSSPLVLSENRLYLRRYWQYEQAVKKGIAQRLARSSDLAATLSTERIRCTLDILFPPSGKVASEPDWQKIACALSARSAFSIMTGGPGTGKTTTVLKLIALLQVLALESEVENGGAPVRPLRIRLAAPTGKAAARLKESIASRLNSLPFDNLNDGASVREAIPVTVTTLHRLLGSRPDSRKFRYHEGNPLAIDLLVIDEASMVDIEMMALVFDALPPNARLILLGDKDQLASVEAGAVLGGLCSRAEDGHYTPETVAWLADATGEPVAPIARIDLAATQLDQAITMLRHSHRFDSASGIGRLAEAVNQGNTATVQQVLESGYGDLAVVSGPDRGNDGLHDLILTDESERVGYRHYLKVVLEACPKAGAVRAAIDDWARQVLLAYGQFQVLCAVRAGPWGVEKLNQRIARWLHQDGLIPATEGWYLGRPVLVTKNTYGLGLMNGDIGITLQLPKGDNEESRPMVAFLSGESDEHGRQGIKWALGGVPNFV